MFPLRDDNPTLGASVATFAVIGINVAVWIFVEGLGSEPWISKSICELGAIPGALLGRLPPGASFEMGRGMVCEIGSTANWLTPFTSMFLHGGWFHIIGNLWFLYVFGDNVEDSMGPLRFVIFYLLCGLAAVAAQIFATPDSAVPMVGASGAISGVMGAYALLYPRVSVHMLIFFGFFFTRIVVPAWFMLGYWFLLQLIAGVPALEAAGGGVAFWAHVGGFLAGALLIGVFRDPQRVAAHRAHVAMMWAREPD